jgi:hypothetical protein
MGSLIHRIFLMYPGRVKNSTLQEIPVDSENGIQ